MQSRLFLLSLDPWLHDADLEQLLQHWDANPRDLETLARVRVQVGPTDTVREARDQLTNHRRVWAERRAVVDAGPQADYPEVPPVVVRGPLRCP